MLIFDFKEYVYSKTVPWFSPMHKDWGNKLCIIYPFIYESVLITYYSPCNQTTFCQYKLSKKQQCSTL